jgi:hypothetical protein
MHDLVAEHGCQLGFGAELGQETAIDGDFPAGQRPGIGHGAVQHDEFVGQAAIADRGEALTDATDIVCERRFDDEIAALHLA